MRAPLLCTALLLPALAGANEPTAPETQGEETAEWGIQQRTSAATSNNGTAPAAASPVALNPGLRPILGFGTYNSPATGSTEFNVILGGEARLGYRSRQAIGFEGATRTRAQWLLGDANKGWEWRLQSVIGPKLGPFSIVAGGEVRYDQYTYGHINYHGVWELGVPMVAKLDFHIVEFFGGAVPLWFVGNPNGREKVDWKSSKIKGFGDEMEYIAGVGVRLGPVKLGVSAETHVATYGTRTSYNIGVNYTIK